MSKKTGHLLGMFLTIIICMILAWFFCCGASSATTNNGTDDRTEVTDGNAVVAATSMPFALRGPDGNFAFNSNDNFNFNASEFDILKPISGQVAEGIGKLKAYFDGNANAMIDITGYYDSDEKNNGAFANLGLARANSVKNYFVDQGINSGRINTYGELRDALVPDGTIYRGPVNYKLYAQAAADKAGEAEAMEDVAKAIKADPLTLYFDYAEASVTLSAEDRRKIGDISRYLDKVDGSTVSVVGHADSKGTTVTNNRLGQERADFAKSYLTKNGISASRIKTSSKGESQPIAENETEAGRAKNRRAVVTIN